MWGTTEPKMSLRGALALSLLWVMRRATEGSSVGGPSAVLILKPLSFPYVTGQCAFLWQCQLCCTHGTAPM